MAKTKASVVLFQLGGPDSPEAIEPFLYNLFSDPDIIDLPLGRWARQPLARMMAAKRARHVQEHYAAIGGGSPIRELTERQARALEAELSSSIDARVFVAMRYWHPFTGEAIEGVMHNRSWNIVLLPLYPQYSKTTTGSSFNEWDRKFEHHPLVNEWKVPHYCDHPLYIRALVEKVESALGRFAPGAEVFLLFSAHGIPVSVVNAGDPYVSQVEETTRLVMEAGGWNHSHRVCYQSKVGSGRWVQPTLVGSLRELGAQGVKNVLVIPVSFVSDHVETLNEIDIEARAEATRAGITQFEMMPALNDSPTFIAALADLVLAAMQKAPGPSEDAKVITFPGSR